MSVLVIHAPLLARKELEESFEDDDEFEDDDDDYLNLNEDEGNPVIYSPSTDSNHILQAMFGMRNPPTWRCLPRR